METREKFEALPRIAKLIKQGEAFYCNKGNYYLCQDIDNSAIELALDVAWHAFQEQQKIINMQECGANQIIEILNNFESSEKPASFYLRKIKELLK